MAGTHEGTRLKGGVKGTVDGDQVKLASGFRTEGAGLRYEFTGKAAGDTIEGEVSLEEYGKARFTARRHRYA